MNLFRINFEELYQRHLCRHGQFGLNVLHLIAVLGIYLSIIGLVDAAIRVLRPETDPVPILALLTIPWLTLLIVNVPLRVFMLTLGTTILLLSTFTLLPQIPFWWHLILMVAWHRFQLWGHRKYTLHRDITAFDTKYRKGLLLFVLLSVYELPLLLNYLVPGRGD